MKIAMAPARPGRNDNPYLTILTNALIRFGVNIVDLTPFTFTKDIDVLHVHWLEYPMWGRLATRFPLWSMARMKRTITMARLLRRQGKPVFWTVHNLRPHDFSSKFHAHVYEKMCSEFLPLVTDVICMSDKVLGLIEPSFPQLVSARFHVIRHPDYTDYFKVFKPLQPNELQTYKISNGPVIGTFGMLRPYKAIPATITAMKAMNSPFTFIIAGKGPDSELAAIRAAIGQDARFIFIARRLSDIEILGMTKACDLMLFNFNSILNSGSVLASLSMGCPVLAPALGAICDLQTDLGENWVRTFDSPLTTEIIETALHDLPISGVPNLLLYSPNKVAQDHVSAYMIGTGAN